MLIVKYIYNLGYMLICQNAEGVHGQRKVGNPCTKASCNDNFYPQILFLCLTMLMIRQFSEVWS